MQIQTVEDKIERFLERKFRISRSRGKIVNYKLRETGESTGIFQGIIGVIGAYGKKYVEGYRLGKKIVKKTQGKGIDDGFIEVRRGEEILFTYKNKSGTAKLIAFSSNFGATISLNQKIYKNTDRVYVTIVAPDFNINSNKKDIIGNKPFNKISIKSSKGKLDSYKLVETNKDTGIFTGSLKLVGQNKDKKFQKKTKIIAKGKGPNDGMLHAQDDDLLNIEFNYFGEEVIEATAKIRSSS